MSKRTTKEMPPEKVYSPFWVFHHTLNELGYDLVYDEEGYFKYVNKPGATSYSSENWKSRSHYGRMASGKRFIYLNTTYNPADQEVYMGIEEDGGTRQVFGGVVRTREEMVFVINRVR